jgi:hypothetical protein
LKQAGSGISVSAISVVATETLGAVFLAFFASGKNDLQ